MSGPVVAPGTVTIFTDVMCAWSTLALHRFYRARSAAGLDDRLRVNHELFLLEDVNEEPHNSVFVEGERPVIAALDESLGIKPWRRHPSDYPVTSLLANEAVHAAKEQSAVAAEQLDFALRMAFWRDTRCISLLHVVLDVAKSCDDVDVDRLGDALDTGRARGQMMRTYRDSREFVRGIPQFFLTDGSTVLNPGVQLHGVREPSEGFLVVDSDDPSAYDDLVRRAAG